MNDGMMTKVQAAVIVVLAAALGVTVSLLMDARRRVDALERRERERSAAPAPLVGEHDAPTDEALYAVVQDLRARVQEVEAKLGIVRQNPAATAEVQRALDEVQDDLAMMPPAFAGTKTPEEARARIQELVKDEMQQAERERDAQRTERWRARTKEKVDALAAEAKLDAEQQQKLTLMLDAETQEIRQMFRDARDSGDFASVREQVRTLRAHTDENALAILDEEQKKAYAAMRDEERNRFLGLGGGGAPRDER
jgi:flagellar basal body-associated protein FliL